MTRQRIDHILVARGLAESRTRAQALIMAGAVWLGERRIDKPGDMLPADAPVELRGRDHPWVSRGGVKLAHGLAHFAVDPANSICLDVGASTGGFTHVLLANGAARVYAVDVGRGQLDWSLRNDPRVVVLEGVNARTLTAEQIPDPIDLVVTDVSFIGLEKALPAALALAKPGAVLIALVKPQFQAGREHVGKGGIVRDPAVHDMVCRHVADWLESTGWHVIGLTGSPIEGAKGNREFLIAAQRG
ncbi:MAG: TlyA family RNA methyltransferase [Alphaproteobacteria bacterium]